MTERVPSSSSNNNAGVRIVLGLLLLLPILFIYLTYQFGPAVNTVLMSMQKVEIFKGASPYIGMANYDKLFTDRAFIQALAYTFILVMTRITIVAVIPPIVGVLVGGQTSGARLFNRMLLTGITVLIAPLALAVLWSMFTSMVWGREPSPLYPVPDWMMLSTPTGAQTSLMLVDALVTLGIAAAVGGAAFMAVMRGRSVSTSNGLAGIGVWLIGIFLTAASIAQTFDLPFVMTAGGPARSTTTLGLLIYDYGFRLMQMGYAAAAVVPMLVVAAVMGFLVWAVMTGLRLRLMFTRPAAPAQNAGLLSLLGFMMLGGIVVLSGGLLVWGFWLASNNQGFDMLAEMVNIGQAFSNTISGPWIAIWFIQIPVAYLAGLSLGFLRPINRAVSQALFLILLIIAFFPAEALSIAWFMMAREMGMVNTTTILAMAWLSSAFSLIVFKMFFDGALEKFNAARDEGQRTSDAFVNMVFLPSLGIVVLVGAVLSFASLQSLLWPLISINDPGLRSLPVSIAAARNSFDMTQQAGAAALVLVNVIITAVIFLPVFALLHVFVLDRLSIVAGPPIELELLMDGLRKAKNDDVSAGETREETF